MTTAAETVEERADEQIAEEHEFDAAAEIAAEEERAEERPTHLAKCRECSTTVTFRPTSSGAGFTVLNHTCPDPEANFGISAAGLPLCPDGHGEMSVADEQLPSAAEAITEVAARTNSTPQQSSLPGTVPVFNFEGAYLELEAKAIEVDALHAQYTEDAETAKESKKRWEKAAEVYQKMGIEFRRRRREKADGPALSEAASVERCRFEQLNPGVPCPLCNDPMWSRSSAPLSEEHGVEAKDVLETREMLQCIERLKLVPHVGLTVEDLRAMPMDLRSELEAWAGDLEDHPAERDRVMGDGLPAGLGTPHKAGELINDGADQPHQLCTECGLLLFTQDEGEEPLAVGTLVRTDCEGKAKQVGQRYPKRHASKPKRQAESKAKGKPAPKKKTAAKRGKR